MTTAALPALAALCRGVVPSLQQSARIGAALEQRLRYVCAAQAAGFMQRRPTIIILHM